MSKTVGTKKIKLATLFSIYFPIGSRYVTQTDTNPSDILGFGTWERMKGRVCVGLDENDTDMNTIGKTGGEKTHKLTIAEMPSHVHKTFIKDTNGGATSDGYDNYFYGAGKYYNNTTSSGENQSHNNMPPYEVVGYVWIRRK